VKVSIPRMLGLLLKAIMSRVSEGWITSAAGIAVILAAVVGVIIIIVVVVVVVVLLRRRRSRSSRFQFPLHSTTLISLAYR